MTEFNKKLTELKSQTGQSQRLLIDVPAPNATLLMGKRITDDPAFGYSGIALRSAENLFVDVGQKTLFQFHGFATFQTADRWTQYSTGPTIVFAKGTVDVSSATSVVVAAVANRQHQPPLGADMKPNNGDAVPAVASFDDVRDDLLSDHKSALGTWNSVADKIASSKKKLGDTFSSNEVTSLTDSAKNFAGGMTANAANAGGIGMVSESAIATFSKSSTVSYGQDGVTIVAGNNSHAADVTALASQSMTLRCDKRAEVHSNGTLSITAGQSADIAAVGAMAVSSRGGNAFVLGKDVFVGSQDPNIGLSDGAKQKPTKTVTLAAKDTAKIDSAKNVEVIGAKKVTLKVGAFQVVIQDSTLKIGNLDGQTTVQITDALVTITAGQNTIKVDKSSGVKITSGGSEVSVGSSGVSVKGSAINLG